MKTWIIPTKMQVYFTWGVTVFLLAGCQLLACAESQQSGFRITGKCPEVPDGTTVLMINPDTHEADSTYVINGEFHFRGHVEYPKPLTFQGSNDQEHRFYFYDQVFVENKVITMELKDERFQVAGSASHDDKKAFFAKRQAIGQPYDAVLQREAFSRQDSLQLEAYFEAVKSAEINFFKRNPDSYFTGYQLMLKTIAPVTGEFNSGRLSKKELAELYTGLSDRIKNSAYGQVIKRYTALPGVPQVGEHFADFILPDVKDTPVKLSDFTGKYILVDFWASWCQPCRYQNPKLKRLYEKYRTGNFEIVGVSIDNNKDHWMKAVEEDGLPWTNVISVGGRTSEVSQLYGINGIPDNVLISPEGVIVKRDIKPDALEEVLAGVLRR